MPRARIRAAKAKFARGIGRLPDTGPTLRPPTSRMPPPTPPAPRASATSRVSDPHPGSEFRVVPEAPRGGALRSPIKPAGNVNERGSQRVRDMTNAAKGPRRYKTS